MNFEGFNLFGRFNTTGKVTLGSDHRYLRNGRAGTYTEHSSVYEMLREESCVLSFSSWNDILTVFVDPVSPNSAPGSIVQDGEGMHGDDRLVMLSYSPDTMMFRGERHGAKVRFIRLDCEPQEYIAKTAETKALVAGSPLMSHCISNGSQTMYLKGLNKGCFQYIDRLDDPLTSSTRSCVFTPKGLSFEHSYKLGDDEYQDFELNAEGDKLVSGNVTITTCWREYIAAMCNASGRVTITADDACDAFAQLYNSLGTAVTEAFSAQTFTGISFGTSNESATNRRTGVVFNMKAKSNNYRVAYTATIKVEGDNLIISVDLDDKSSNYNSYNKKGIGSQFDALAAALNGTYTLTPNNYFSVDKVKATKVDDANFYFYMNM